MNFEHVFKIWEKPILSSVVKYFQLLKITLNNYKKNLRIIEDKIILK